MRPDSVKSARLGPAFTVELQACDEIRFAIQKNSVEHWLLTNLSGDWEHPIHIHLEEHQILSRQRQPVTPVEVARKDVTRLVRNERVQLFFRFRDFTGKYPIHCHNTNHYDRVFSIGLTNRQKADLVEYLKSL